MPVIGRRLHGYGGPAPDANGRGGRPCWFCGGWAPLTRAVPWRTALMATATGRWLRPGATTWTSPAAATCIVIADGGIGRSGDLSRAIACGADAAKVSALPSPARGGSGTCAGTGGRRRPTRTCRGQRVHVLARRARSTDPIALDARRRLPGISWAPPKRTMASTGYSEASRPPARPGGRLPRLGVS